MTLIDSSAWIEYYRRGGSREVRDAVFSTIRDNRAATNGAVLVEVAAHLLHFDAHYELIAQHQPLVTHSPLKPPTAVPSHERPKNEPTA